MAKKIQFARLYDRVETNSAAERSIDISHFAGTWNNANPETASIARLEISVEGGEFQLQVFAIGEDGLIDWGPAVDSEIFATTPSSTLGAGFIATYDFGFAETKLQGNINKGLIVLAQFNRFRDDSKRMNFFTREYFALRHRRY